MNKLLQSSPKHQEGAVLIVSLLLLVILTMLGISAMESTKLETKMASNTAQMNRALQTAEAAISRLHSEFYDRTKSLDKSVAEKACPGEDNPIEISGCQYWCTDYRGHIGGKSGDITTIYNFFATLVGRCGEGDDAPMVKVRAGWKLQGKD